MRRLVFSAAMAATMLLGGAVAWQAGAAGLAGGDPRAIMREMSPIQPTACVRTGAKCPPGHHWICGPAGHCRCVPC